jgi:DNA polymerase-3 subunit epsilon/exodeoxyribonuclease X
LWTHAPLVALDLEGTGAQDRDAEAILEIALIPITAGRPSPDGAYTTPINPGRRIRQRPWISPGLTNSALAAAPRLSDVEPLLHQRLSAKILVGHNIAVDWRLLHRRCPTIKPSGLIDTLRLARHLHPGLREKSLTALIERYALTDRVTDLAPGSRPHRALWDATAAALLLTALVNDLPNSAALGLNELRHVSGLPMQDDPQPPDAAEQLPLL